jgi:hypothetical protein
MPSLRLLPLLAAAFMTSCVVPGDYAGGPRYTSVTTGYRQYSRLPNGYVGDAYFYGGRYFSGGRYETGAFYDQGRSYNDRYYYNGRYYYGGKHQTHGSHPAPRHVGYDRNLDTRVSTPRPYSPNPYSPARRSYQSPFFYQR